MGRNWDNNMHVKVCADLGYLQSVVGQKGRSFKDILVECHGSNPEPYFVIADVGDDAERRGAPPDLFEAAGRG